MEFTQAAGAYPQTETMRQASADFGQDPRLAIISLHTNETPEQALRYINEAALDWTQGFLGYDGPARTQEIMNRYEIGHYFANYFVGPDGKVIAKDLPTGAMHAALAAALKK